MKWPWGRKIVFKRVTDWDNDCLPLVVHGVTGSKEIQSDITQWGNVSRDADCVSLNARGRSGLLFDSINYIYSTQVSCILTKSIERCRALFAAFSSRYSLSWIKRCKMFHSLEDIILLIVIQCMCWRSARPQTLSRFSPFYCWICVFHLPESIPSSRVMPMKIEEGQLRMALCLPSLL